MNNNPDKVFRVDKKLVIKSFLPFQIFFVVALIIFLNGVSQIPKTITSQEFWLWTLGIIVLGLIIDLWAILRECVEFRGNEIVSYVDWSESANVLDFASVKEKKTIYFDSLGFEYKVPKGNKLRYLLAYKHFHPKTLQAIMQEIVRINPSIRLEDELSKQILAGTYK